MNKINEFYDDLYNLSYITRYAGVPRIRDENVAEHSFYVASLVIRLSDSYDFDVGKATMMAVMHDWTEAWIGDVTIATKRLSKDICTAIDKASDIAAIKYFSHSEWALYECLNLDSPEALIVHMADIIQCIQYSSHEIKLGNTGYMQTVHDESILRLKAIKERLKDYEL